MSTRTDYRPAVSLAEYAAQRGVPEPLESDYAELIGGAYAETTRNGRGKLTAPAGRIAAFVAVAEEYRAACGDGSIPFVAETRPLREDSEADRAYLRAKQRRDARRSARRTPAEQTVGVA